MRWQGGRFLVLFTGEERRVSSRFYLFVYDTNQGNEGAGWVQELLVWSQGWEDSPYIFCKISKMVDMYLFVFVLSFIIGVVKAHEPNLLKEFGGHLELTHDWARHLLESMEWVKRK